MKKNAWLLAADTESGRRGLLCLLIPLMMLLAACSSTPTELSIDPDDWVYEKRAIDIMIKAPADLNSVSGRPHALALGIFQLNDPNTFNGLAATVEGAVELLQKGQIDESVVNFRLINVRPGEQKRVFLNRAQTAQYIGVIAGYYQLNPAKDVKVFAIPLKAIESGLVEKGLVALSLMTDEAKALPDKLNIVADLGRTGSKQIKDVGSITVVEEKDSKKVQWQEMLKKAGNLPSK